MDSRSFNIITAEGVVAKDVPEDKVMVFINSLLDNGMTNIVSITEYTEPFLEENLSYNNKKATKNIN